MVLRRPVESALDPKVDIDWHQETNETLRQIAGQHTGVQTLNFEASGIFSEAPFVDGMPIYFDDHHLNEEGAKKYAAAALSTFRKILY